MKKITIILLSILTLNSCSYFGDSGVSFSSESSLISVADNGAPLSLKQTNTITWSPNGIDEASVVHHYEVSLGTSPGSTDTVGWTNVALARSYQFTQTLDPATTYYANVRYVDKTTLIASAAYSSPGFAAPINAAEQISMGSTHTCAINRQGKLKCWGANSYGQLGYDDTVQRGDQAGEMAALGYVNLGSGRTAKSMALGALHTCVILDNDQLKCWGANTTGQLGYDDTVQRGDQAGEMAALGYVNLGVGRTAKSIAAGAANTCVILDNDQIKCWGNNLYGHLGYDDTVQRGDQAGEMAALGYVNLGVGRTAKSISLGYAHTCVILDNNQIKCWGNNFDGALGYDDAVSRGDNVGEMTALGYVNLGIGRTAKSVAAGYSNTCAVLDNDELKCWGYNGMGALGYDDTANRGDQAGEMTALGYVNLGVGRTAKGIYPSGFSICATLDNDLVKCWGNGAPGNDANVTLGDNAGEMAALGYVNLGVGRTVKNLSAGGGSFCSILDDNQIKCWGLNINGQLGYDDMATRGNTLYSMASLPTINLGGGRTAKKIVRSAFFTCAHLDNDQLKCWGDNAEGQLGYDDTVDRGAIAGDMAALNYVNLGPGRTLKSIEISYYHSCAILDNDQVKCWGRNNNGQLGYDDMLNRGDQAGEMAALGYVNLGVGRTAKQIAVSNSSTCAILDNDQLKCWGNGAFAQLGYDDMVTRGDQAGEMAALGYVNLGVGRTAKKVSLGSSHTCTVLDNNEIKCWGSNSNGQLGYDDINGRGFAAGHMAALAYVNLGVGRTAKDVSVGSSYTCAVLDNDQVKCWGQNNNGQLGYDDTANRGDSAGEMAALGYVNFGVGRTVKQLSAGNLQNCAILDNDQVKCWGQNTSSQLGYDHATNMGSAAGNMAALGYVNLGVGLTAKKVDRGCAVLNTDAVKCWGNNAFGLGYDNILTYGNGQPMSSVTSNLYLP